MQPRNLMLAAALAVALTGVVSAKSDKSGALVPGGRTVAGPGTATAAAGVNAPLFLYGNVQFDGCVTAVNVGSHLAAVTVSGGGTDALPLDPGETGVLCHADMYALQLTCHGTGTDVCAVQWRLDAL
jgi:hypothetical protein